MVWHFVGRIQGYRANIKKHHDDYDDDSDNKNGHDDDTGDENLQWLGLTYVIDGTQGAF